MVFPLRILHEVRPLNLPEMIKRVIIELSPRSCNLCQGVNKNIQKYVLLLKQPLNLTIQPGQGLLADPVCVALVTPVSQASYPGQHCLRTQNFRKKMTATRIARMFLGQEINVQYKFLWRIFYLSFVTVNFPTYFKGEKKYSKAWAEEERNI